VTPDEIEAIVKRTLRREREPTATEEMDELIGLQRRQIKALEETLTLTKEMLRLARSSNTLKDDTIALYKNTFEQMRADWNAVLGKKSAQAGTLSAEAAP
jgi:hypothetical protein